MKFISFTLFILSAYSLFDGNKLVKQIKNMNQVEKVLTKNQVVTLFYFYVNENCDNCLSALTLIEKIADEQQGVIKVYHIECNRIWEDSYSHSKFPQCQPEYHKQLPQVSFYEPPPYKINPYTNRPMEAIEHRFQGEASPKGLAEFGQKLLKKELRIRINNMKEYEDFLEVESHLKKVILFTEKNKTAPIYKALAIQYHKRLYFGEVSENDDNNPILDEFEIEEFPQLFILYKNDDGSCCAREMFEGDMLWQPMTEWLDEFAESEEQELENLQIFDKPPEDDRRRRRRREQDEKQQQEKQQQQQQQKQEIKTLTADLLEKELLLNEKPSLVSVFRSDKPHPNWEAVQKKYRSLFNYYQLEVQNQDDQKFAKQELSARSLPTIRFFPAGTPEKKKATKVFFPGDVEFEEIQKDIQDLIDDKSISVNEQELQFQLQGGLQENKILIILFYNTPSVSLTFRVVSQLSQFQSKFKFVSFKNAPEMILQQFQVKQQPSVISVFREVKNDEEFEEPLKNEQIRMATYTGKLMYNEFVEFLKIFDKESQQKKTTKQLKFIQNQDDFDQVCKKQSTLCFLGLLNGFQHKKENHESGKTKLEYQLEVMEKIKDKFGHKSVGFGYIDANCHDEVFMPLDISEDYLPNYISYSSSKKQYSKMIGTFDLESITRFADNHLKGKTALYNTELEIKEKNCEEVYEEREKRRLEASKFDEDDDILREILEEERKKREEIEKELKKEKKKKSKKKKDL